MSLSCTVAQNVKTSEHALVYTHRTGTKTYGAGLVLSTTISWLQEQRHRIKIHHTCGFILRSPSQHKRTQPLHIVYSARSENTAVLKDFRRTSSPWGTWVLVHWSTVLVCLELIQCNMDEDRLEATPWWYAWGGLECEDWSYLPLYKAVQIVTRMSLTQLMTLSLISVVLCELDCVLQTG